MPKELLPSSPIEIRDLAESDLAAFIRLVAPGRLIGGVHMELLEYWTRAGASTHQLALLPRGHQKSAMAAYYTAWQITKNPATTVLYLSGTATLAEKQLKFIKDILTSAIYTRYWPDMVRKEEGKREKWTSTEIAVDHPLRKTEGIRDSTIYTAGLTSTVTGQHYDIIVLDDLIVPENAYTEEGRRKVKSAYSHVASIGNPESKRLVVGTRYHPRDLYQLLKERTVDIYEEDGGLESSEPLFETFERVVEEAGEFLWPRTTRRDGKLFGFNRQVLAKIKSEYLDKAQFFAQYYNDPNDRESAPIKPESFQYYNKNDIENREGYWYYGESRLIVYAAIDFAFSLKKTADYSAVITIGMDNKENIFILDINRFKTDRIQDYFKAIYVQYHKWGFRKLRAETTVAQVTIVKDLESTMRKNRIPIVIDHFKPNRHMGSKEERMKATLQPRYDNKMIWHYRGGNCQLLEEELVMEHPPHDDLKDALTAAIDIAKPPGHMWGQMQHSARKVLNTHPRFGGLI